MPSLLLGLLLSGAVVPQSVLDLQQFRQASSRDATTLVNLNPNINVWFVFSEHGHTWHLENPQPRTARIELDEKSELTLIEGGKRYTCASPAQGAGSPLIYYPLCGGRLYLRNPAKGSRTGLESATEFLRDQVWGGEKVVAVFHHLLADRYRETGNEVGGAAIATDAADGPAAAALDAERVVRMAVPESLGIAVEAKSLIPGDWYPAEGNAGVYISVIQPNLIASAILHSYTSNVSSLDSVEASSLCYLVAFDLDRFELGYALGTDHPQVNWSARVLPQMKDPRLPGPDGIGSIAPLISTGLISPENGRRTVATFTGGFKRTHGAFRYGDLSLKNHGSHYGFIENGVVFSKLQPGLATVYVLDDGSVAMKTWSDADNNLLPRIRHARQNGVPIVESKIPGSLVARWGPGNWSGSEDEKLRTIRGGIAMQQLNGRRFLIYAVFSDATPSAMARVFQAYRCDYAMLLDMNALEHTYMALYRRSGSQLLVGHLLKGMSQLDKAADGEVVPRFLGFPDNRDFFYVMRRNAKEVQK